MRQTLRMAGDKVFTVGSAFSVFLLIAALIVILGPMILRGCTAVLFEGTVEHREMLLREFGREDKQAVEAELAETDQARQAAYDVIDAYKREIGFETALDPVLDAAKQFGREATRVWQQRVRAVEPVISERIVQPLEQIITSANGTPDQRAAAAGRLQEVLKCQDAPELAAFSEHIVPLLTTAGRELPPILAAEPPAGGEPLATRNARLAEVRAAAGRIRFVLDEWPYTVREAFRLHGPRALESAMEILETHDVLRLPVVLETIRQTLLLVDHPRMTRDQVLRRLLEIRGRFSAEEIERFGRLYAMLGEGNWRGVRLDLLEYVNQRLAGEADPEIQRHLQAVLEALAAAPRTAAGDDALGVRIVFGSLVRSLGRLTTEDRIAPFLDAHGPVDAGRSAQDALELLLRVHANMTLTPGAVAEEGRPQGDELRTFLELREDLRDTPASDFEAETRKFLALMEEKGVQVAAMRRIVRILDDRLLGPRPGEQRSVIDNKYGATRWDQAQGLLQEVLYETSHVPIGQGRTQRVVVPSARRFEGTKLAALFPLLETRLADMLHPRQTFYWRYFVDDCTEGHLYGGVGPETVGTVMVVVLCIVVAVPLAVVAAAYLTEFSREGLIVKVIRTCVNTLAGVPSIVFGLFGLAFFVLVFLPWFGFEPKPSLLAGAMTLAVLVLPVLIRASEEAIRAVPQTYKEASLALGAGRLRAFCTVTLPAALPGILTGVILSLSRAAGETAPLLFTAAVAFTRGYTVNLHERVRTLTYSSYDLAMGDRLAARVPHQQFGMVMTLIGVVLLLNLVAIVVRGRLARKLRGQ